MQLKTLIIAILMGASTISFVPQIRAAQTPEGPHLVTSGTSCVEAMPDMATLSIQVTILAKEATAAKKQVDARIVHYFDFLRKNGIDKKEIDTANIEIHPEYDYPKNEEKVFKGYRASRQIRVTVHQLSKINELLDGALKVGLNEIRDIKLGVSDPSLYREQARKKAVENAMTQAESLTKEFKVRLGPVYSIRYHVNDDQRMPVRLMMAQSRSLGAGGGNNEINETYGTQTIYFNDQVDVVFYLQTKGSE
ncbi:oxidative stress defense protein [Rickettsiella massiliensis]|uniref:oxidative stress defense protein n=1 Tax=Rickettsiella massiliensis TaxID=676517 RepID=UPI000299DB26|nr:oxidative stress defense protein [Rickettsiella massiliensis]